VQPWLCLALGISLVFKLSEDYSWQVFFIVKERILNSFPATCYAAMGWFGSNRHPQLDKRLGQVPPMASYKKSHFLFFRGAVWASYLH
jgi:hypothetical protein